MDIKLKRMILVAHGSHDPIHRMQVEKVSEAVRLEMPGREVQSSYLELDKPHFGNSLRNLAARGADIEILPLLIFRGGHMDHDIPAAMFAARREHPLLNLKVNDVLSRRPGMEAWVAGLARLQRLGNQRVVLVLRGGNELARADGAEFAYRLSEFDPEMEIDLAWADQAGPGLGEVLAQVADTEGLPPLVLPMLLFKGQLYSKVRADFDLAMQRGQIHERCWLGPLVEAPGFLPMLLQPALHVPKAAVAAGGLRKA